MVTLRRITIAVTDMDAMIAFYNALFDAGMEPFEMAGFTLYQGEIAGIDLVFCPNDMLGIEAERNRQQFDFAVAQADPLIEAARANGGQLLNQSGVIGEGGTRYVSLIDPDGNTLVLIEGET